MHFTLTYRQSIALLFGISFVMLMYQIALSRILALVLPPYYIFAGVSVALFGSALGAARVYSISHGKEASDISGHIQNLLTCLAVSMPVAMVLFHLPHMLFSNEWAEPIMKGFILLFTIPFAFVGMIITLVMTRTTHSIHALYAADFIGAAAGAAGICVLLLFLDPFSVCLILTFLCLAYRVHINPQVKLYPLLGMATALGIFIVNTVLYYNASPYIGRYTDKPNFNTGFVAKDNLLDRWNVYSHIKISNFGNRIPHGDGFGIPPKTTIEQLFISIDDKTASIITRYRNDPNELAFLANDVTYIPYQTRPISDVAVIGVGGGRDVLAGFYFKATDIVGLEVNPIIVRAITKDFAEFTGGVFTKPPVRIIQSEARYWITHAHQSFDLIQIPMINSWGASAAANVAFAQNKIFTTEAWNDFMTSLSPSGIFSVTRPYSQIMYQRLLALSVITLRAQGISDETMRDHIVILRGGKLMTLMLSRAAFTPSELTSLEALAKERKFTKILAANKPLNSLSTPFFEKNGGAENFDFLMREARPSTDDKPFFTDFIYLSDWLKGTAPKGWFGGLANNFVVQVFLLALISFAFLLGWFLLHRFYVTQDRHETQNSLLPSFYFIAIGIGFMLVEISHMQRLMMILGNPTFGLSVVLFSLLLFGGIGSLMTQSFRLSAQTVSVCLLVALILTGYATSTVVDKTKMLPIAWDVMLAVATLAPIGFFMGMMFPLGVRFYHEQQKNLPWFWGINSAACVLGSVLSVMVSIEWGITRTYELGVAFYFLAVMILLAKKTKERYS